MLSAESLEGLGRAQGRGGVAAQDFEYGISDRVDVAIDGAMAELGRAPVRNVDQLARALDFAQLPIRSGEEGGRDGRPCTRRSVPAPPLHGRGRKRRAPARNGFAPPRNRREE